MKQNSIFRTLDRLELLLLFSPNQSLSSRDLRQNFPQVSMTTIYARLERLIKKQIVEKIDKKKAGKKIKPGGLKKEYALTNLGVKLQKEIVSRAISALSPAIEQIVEERTAASLPEKTANNKSEKKQKINDFILEFFEECSHLLNGKTIKELQEVLSKLLRYYL